MAARVRFPRLGKLEVDALLSIYHWTITGRPCCVAATYAQPSRSTVEEGIPPCVQWRDLAYAQQEGIRRTWRWRVVAVNAVASVVLEREFRNHGVPGALRGLERHHLLEAWPWVRCAYEGYTWRLGPDRVMTLDIVDAPRGSLLYGILVDGKCTFETVRIAPEEHRDLFTLTPWGLEVAAELDVGGCDAVRRSVEGPVPDAVPTRRTGLEEPTAARASMTSWPALGHLLAQYLRQLHEDQKHHRYGHGCVRYQEARRRVRDTVLKPLRKHFPLSLSAC